MKKEIILGVIVVLFLIPFISAQPPFQQSDSDIGLILESPVIESINNDNDFTFHIHVFNKTDGVHLTNSSVSCLIHVYNPETGGHLVQSIMDWDSNNIDFEHTVSGADFIDNRQHAVMFQCNTTGQDIATMGGFLEYPFYTNPSGTRITEGQSILYVVLLLGSVFLLLLSLYGSIVIPFSNKRSELGSIIQVQYLKYFKVLFMSLSYILMLWVINLLHVLSRNFDELSQFTTIFSVSFTVLNAIALPLFVLIFIGCLFLLWKDLKLEKMLLRGLDVR